MRGLFAVILIFAQLLLCVACSTSDIYDGLLTDGVAGFADTGARASTADIIVSTAGFGKSGVAAAYVNESLYSNERVIDGGPIAGGSLRVYSTLPDTFNPLLTRNEYIKALLSLVYEGLAKTGSGMKPVYCLASEWWVEDDPLTWFVKLNGDVRWHDGRSLSAQDVADTVRQIKAYGDMSSYHGMVSNIDSVSIISENELIFKLFKENSFFPYTLTFPIVPSHADIGQLSLLSNSGAIGDSLVGTGPYRFRDYLPGTGFMLTANRDWTGAGIPLSQTQKTAQSKQASPALRQPSPPYIQDVDFVFFDPSVSALSQFRANKVDTFFSRNYEYALYENSPDAQTKRYSEREFVFIALNNAKGATASSDVRRALIRMIDRQTLVNTALKGRGIVADYPVLPENALNKAVNVSTPHDPEAARLILESAGYRENNGLWFGDINGGWNQFTLDLIVNAGDESQIDVARFLADSLKSYGITLNIVPLGAEEVTAKLAGNDYQAALLNYRVNSFPDMTELYSEGWFQGGIGTNPSRYENENIDRLTSELYSVYNDADMLEKFSQMTASLHGDVPLIGLFFRASSLVCGQGIRGGLYPSAGNPLAGFERWYIVER